MFAVEGSEQEDVVEAIQSTDFTAKGYVEAFNYHLEDPAHPYLVTELIRNDYLDSVSEDRYTVIPDLGVAIVVGGLLPITREYVPQDSPAGLFFSYREFTSAVDQAVALLESSITGVVGEPQMDRYRARIRFAISNRMINSLTSWHSLFEHL